jgi:hypothetical protein
MEPLVIFFFRYICRDNWGDEENEVILAKRRLTRRWVFEESLRRWMRTEIKEERFKKIIFKRINCLFDMIVTLKFICNLRILFSNFYDVLFYFFARDDVLFIYFFYEKIDVLFNICIKSYFYFKIIS